MSADFWLLLIFAFLFGVLVGWVLQRRAGENAPGPGDQSQSLDALAQHMATARQRLEENEKDAAETAKSLAEIEQAVEAADKRLEEIASVTGTGDYKK